ncbi:DUF3325 domain-containing protein [Roseomonas gilardii]|uniref:DUF3325 domain-containing protein n=1 Tax=Roseomonas gilardii TaxID=257708 RepID=UPI0004B84929|nr:DUF3325 domain-containing protein [Roseomonas gilardii]SUE42570.1 Protein of uncharacterised function (DUF3325) [Roseomonas gilardii subsp. rosea]
MTGLGFASLSFALAYAGFTGLCLAMERHHEQVFGVRRIPRLRRLGLTGGGWLLLTGSLLPLLTAQGTGAGAGITLWLGLLTAAALALALLLSYAPRRVPAVTLAFAVLAGSALLLPA